MHVFVTGGTGGQDAGPSYLMARDEPQREALRDSMRAAVPTNDDDAISLTARAWAIRATALSTRP